MTCLSCLRGWHAECLKGCKKCHTKDDIPVADDQQGELEPAVRKMGGTREKLKDPQSTGRKRAARLYPIENGMACEWRKLKNCGGGRHPVIGCLDGIARDRHHGPVKNVTRNHAGNVHRICSTCHQHWHELNDLVYDEKDYALLPHDPMPATDEEIAKNFLAWKTGEMGRLYKLASSENKKKFKESLNHE